MFLHAQREGKGAADTKKKTQERQKEDTLRTEKLLAGQNEDS